MSKEITKHFELRPGDDFGLCLTVLVDPANVPVTSLSAYRISLFVKEHPEDSDEDAVIVMNKSEGAMLVSGNRAYIVIKGPVSLEKLKPNRGSYHYALKVRTSAGTDATRYSGEFRILAPVMRGVAA